MIRHGNRNQVPTTGMFHFSVGNKQAGKRGQICAVCILGLSETNPGIIDVQLLSTAKTNRRVNCSSTN